MNHTCATNQHGFKIVILCVIFFSFLKEQSHPINLQRIWYFCANPKEESAGKCNKAAYWLITIKKEHWKILQTKQKLKCLCGDTGVVAVMMILMVGLKMSNRRRQAIEGPFLMAKQQYNTRWQKQWKIEIREWNSSKLMLQFKFSIIFAMEKNIEQVSFSALKPHEANELKMH